MRLLALTSTFAVLLVAPAMAQIGNPGFMAPGTKMSAPGFPAPHQTNDTDVLFSSLAAMGGMAEVEFGRLAEQKAENAEVKDFASRMIKDHTAANDKLKELAKAAGIDLPGQMDAEHQKLRAELEQMSGAAFDVAYMQGQVADHQKAVQIFEWEINSGQDAELQRFTADTLPTLFHHLRMAQDLVAELTGSATREVASRSMAE
jgi:putative membrane protein